MIVPMFIMMGYIRLEQSNSEIIHLFQPLGIVYEIIGFGFMIIATSSSFIFKIKIKIPKENYGIIHPKIFKLGALLIIAGLLFQLMNSM